MRDRINTGQTGNALWHRERQLRIQNCDAACRARITARHLYMRFRVTDQRETLCLAAGTGCRRNSDHRQQIRGRLAHAVVVMDRAAATENEVHPLAAIQAAAAAESDQQVRLKICGRGDPGVHHRGSRVFRKVMERADLETGAAKMTGHAIEMSCVDNSRIADHHDATPAE